ncbi:MAG: GNAT family N-acetyltransferase [Clostridia bacterium]|nr:GNAT family N-acetyltransferase [Clostridia bacterium]
METAAFEYFERAPLIHVDMSEAIKRGRAKVLYAGSDGVLLHNEKKGNYLLSSVSYRAAAKLCELIEGDCVVVRGEGAKEAVQSELGFELGKPCFQCAYLKTERLAVEREEDIRPLRREHIEEVLKHYRLVGEPAYIEGRIDAGEMFGLFDRATGGLMGFAGLHDDGSGGMLEIFPEYRRRGLGLQLERYLVNFQLDKGYVPYGHIYVDNEQSLNLQRKLGMEISAETLNWAFIGR